MLPAYSQDPSVNFVFTELNFADEEEEYSGPPSGKLKVIIDTSEYLIGEVNGYSYEIAPKDYGSLMIPADALKAIEFAEEGYRTIYAIVRSYPSEKLIIIRSEQDEFNEYLEVPVLWKIEQVTDNI